MRIRKSHKVATSHDGVPPSHTLITCTYQKLFKKDIVASMDAPHGATTHHELGKGVMVQRHRRHDLGWSNGTRKSKEELNNLVLHVGNHGDSAVHDCPQDLHRAVTHSYNPLPKRRKVKSSRYAEFSEKYSEETSDIVHHTTKAAKRSQNIEKDSFMDDTAEYAKTVATSKEALIASIFYVFDTVGKDGLTASEVVSIMLEQQFPGLKEGGARHTVQVANVLRRSRHFIAIGNKKYLPCSVIEDSSRKHGRNGQASKSKQQGRSDCKLYDGSGWFCPRESSPGFSLCAHHLHMINKPGQDSAHLESSVSQKEGRESDSDREESDDVGLSLTKWSSRDRTPGSVPMQKRKMLSLMSIK